MSFKYFSPHVVALALVLFPFLAARHRQRLCGIPISLPLVACNKIFSRGRRVAAGGRWGQGRWGLLVGVFWIVSSFFSFSFVFFQLSLTLVVCHRWLDWVVSFYCVLPPSPLPPAAHHKIRICVRVCTYVCAAFSFRLFMFVMLRLSSFCISSDAHLKALWLNSFMSPGNKTALHAALHTERAQP